MVGYCRNETDYQLSHVLSQPRGVLAQARYTGGLSGPAAIPARPQDFQIMSQLNPKVGFVSLGCPRDLRNILQAAFSGFTNVRRWPWPIR